MIFQFQNFLIMYPIKISYKITTLLFSIKSHSHFHSSNSSIFAEKLASSLERCNNANSLKKLHACIFIHGLETNSFVGSKLLNAYAFFGLLNESRSDFYRLINKNLGLWDSILAGYFKACEFDQVLKVYLDLKQRKIGINGSAFTFSLKSCVQLRKLEFGKGVHVDVLKLGLNTDRFVGSSLIGFYTICRDMVDACKVFDEITERDVVAYTSLITGYTQTDDYRDGYKAFDVVRRMQSENMEPNRVTLVSLLQASARLGLLDHGELIHTYAIRRGIGCFDEVFETSLMDMYVKCGSPNKATMVFGKMRIKTTGCWNVLIGGYLKSRQLFEALNLFSIMAQEGQRFDLITLVNGIVSCADLCLLRVGKSIHGYMFRTGVQLDVVAKTALIDMYSKCNKCGKAREIFDNMKDKDVVSFNVMMAGYLQNGYSREAIEAFHNMRTLGLTENEATILTVVSAYSDLKDIRQGTSIHGFVITHGFESKTDIANQVMYLYVKCDYIYYARKVFDQIKHKDLVSWTSMMMGYESLGHANEAITLFQNMQSVKELNPDSVTLTCLLQAFSQLGCLGQIKEIHCHVIRVSMENEITIMNSLLTTYSKCGMYKTAKDLFHQMGVKCLASWNTMIAASGMHGDCFRALELINQMKKETIVPDEVTFMSALSSCSHAGLVDEGLNLFRMMKEEYGLDPGEEHYGCMVDLLGRAGQLEEAFDFLKCLPPTQSGSALGALVAACRVHGNNEMGEGLGRWLLDFNPENSSSYGLVSNMYAENEKWNEAAHTRDAAKQKGLKMTTGCSRI